MVFGDFEVVRTIQQGEESELFEVRSERPDGFVRRAVIKVLVSESSEARVRFAREARWLACIRDPRVVQIWDYGIDEGRPFQVLELIEGQDLAAWVSARGAMPVVHAVEVTLEVSLALRALHEARDASGRWGALTHNDLAPENVLLGLGGFVKLIDLGHADRIASRPASWVHGRRPFLAPERLRGGAPSVAADLFAAGGILGFLCLGYAPFEEPSAQAHLLAGRSPKLPGSLPEPVAAVLRRACHPDPRRRFQSAQDIARACEKLMSALKPSTDLRTWLRTKAGLSRESMGRNETSCAGNNREPVRERMRTLFEVDVSVAGPPVPDHSLILPVEDPKSQVLGSDSEVAWAILAAIGRRGAGELYVAHRDRMKPTTDLGDGVPPLGGVPPGICLLKLFDPGSVAGVHLERELGAVQRFAVPGLLVPLSLGVWQERRFVAFEYRIGRPLGRMLRDLRARGKPLPLGFVQQMGLDMARARLALAQIRTRSGFRDDLLLAPGSIFVGIDERLLLTEVALATVTERAALGRTAERRLSLVELVWRLVAAEANGSSLERVLGELANGNQSEREKLAGLQVILTSARSTGEPVHMLDLYRGEVEAECQWLARTVLDLKVEDFEGKSASEPKLDSEQPALSTIADEVSPIREDPTLPLPFA